ncbi:MAG: tetratricopeptide repeat protein [Saprospiraceae bacterium]
METIVTSDGSVKNEIISKVDELNSQAWKIHVTQPQQGLELSIQAKKLSEKNNYKKGLAYAIRNIGVSNRYLSNLETALSHSLQALDMFIELGDKSGESQALVSTGAIYYYMGDYDKGLDYFLQGLQHGEEAGNNEAVTYAYNGAGYIYSLLGDNKKGLEFLQKALILCRELKNFSLESSILESLATIYRNDEQIDKAHETYLECLHLSEQNNEKRNLGYALRGIGDILVKQNKPEEAKMYFLRSIDIHKQIGYKVGMARSLCHVGKIFLSQNKSDDAIKYLQESLDVGESIKAKAVIYEAHEAFAELYRYTKNFELFVHHYKLFHKYKTEVFKDEQETKQKYLSIQHEMEKLKQETEINRLTNVVMKEKNEELEKKTSELEQSYNSISVLSQIGKEITSTLNLDTILNTVYEKVNELMDASIFGIGIYYPENETIEYRLAIEKGVRYQPYKRTMENKNQLPVWCIENKKEIFINDIRKEYSNYINDYIEESGVLEDGSLSSVPISFIYLPLIVKEKVFGLITVQSFNKNAYSQYHLDILKTLASYASAALYNAQSFATLQDTLKDLKMTQQQLIQSEKMASLGELTAGIAHEIQNPLNFVNNFSEVTNELVDEMNVELDKGDITEAKAIAEDVKQNLVKINHHGKRADAIVKGMLQHSRSSSAVKEPTDINVLADEYIRLCYHGLRAKDKSFNAIMKTDFDKSIGKINIIPQDVGRVLLNLYNNAFYVVNEKKLQIQGDYEPTVSIITKKINDKVEIKVIDNGNGIPQKVLDKIFQPFFTTKPTGQGTGLGLSLSYDIIKAHGGELKVETKEGEGSKFIVTISV